MEKSVKLNLGSAILDKNVVEELSAIEKAIKKSELGLSMIKAQEHVTPKTIYEHLESMYDDCLLCMYYCVCSRCILTNNLCMLYKSVSYDANTDRMERVLLEIKQRLVHRKYNLIEGNNYA